MITPLIWADRLCIRRDPGPLQFTFDATGSRPQYGVDSCKSPARASKDPIFAAKGFGKDLTGIQGYVDSIEGSRNFLYLWF